MKDIFIIGKYNTFAIMKIIFSSVSARDVQQKKTINMNKSTQSRIITPTISKPKNSNYHHEYIHDDVYMETNVMHEKNRIVIKHSYRWFDKNNKRHTKTDLQVIRK